MAEGQVTLDAAGSMAMVTLNRPERHNALVPGLLEELLSTLADDRSRSASAVILAARGRSFSTGGDLLGFWEHRETIADYARRLVGLLNEAILAIQAHPVPVACAVQGQVTGGSLGLVLAADRTIMRRGVTITPWHSVVGFSPDGGWTSMLPRMIGRQAAEDWLDANRTAGADACLEMGIAHEVTNENVIDAARAWANRVAERGLPRQRQRRFNTDTETLKARLEAERSAFVRQIQTPEALAGIARFLGKKHIEESP